MKPDPPNELFTPNRNLNHQLNRLLPLFDAESQKAIAKNLRFKRAAAIKHKPTTIRAQIFDIYAELILGEHLLNLGFCVRYSQKLDDKTPDWLDMQSRLMVDVVTAGPPAEVFEQVDRLGAWCGFAEADGVPQSEVRIHKAIESKAAKYRQIIRKHDLRYVVAVYGSFENDASLADGRRAIERWNPFEGRPHISGILYYLHSESEFSFVYFNNPKAECPIDLSGRLAGR